MTAPVREGDVLAGKYVVERLLGAGGMGVVVAARHLQLDERFALKFLLPEMTTNPQVVERFMREGRAAVKIRSEHVARVQDVGTLDTGAPYLVMEYLEGQDLAALLQSGPLAVDTAVEFVLQACEAIAAAHALGIVHRDLKPHNLFLTTRNDGTPCVKVLDFGISKAPVGQAEAMTHTGAMIGSPLYMSPEQMTSAKDADLRTDIWALGVILYELLTGKTPFTAETIPQLIINVMQQAPPPIKSLRPDVPPELESVVLCCLEKDLGRRFQSVAELARALAPWGPERAAVSAERVSRILGAPAGPASASVQVTATSPSASARSGEEASTQQAWDQSRADPRASWRGGVLAVLGVAVVAVAAGLFAWQRASGASQLATQEPSPSAAPSTTSAPLLSAEPAPAPSPAPVLPASAEPAATPSAPPPTHAASPRVAAPGPSAAPKASAAEKPAPTSTKKPNAVPDDRK